MFLCLLSSLCCSSIFLKKDWPKEEKLKNCKWSMKTGIDRDIPYKSKVLQKGQTWHSSLNETKVAVGEGSLGRRDCFGKLGCHGVLDVSLSKQRQKVAANSNCNHGQISEHSARWFIIHLILYMHENGVKLIWFAWCLLVTRVDDVMSSRELLEYNKRCFPCFSHSEQREQVLHRQRQVMWGEYWEVSEETMLGASKCHTTLAYI